MSWSNLLGAGSNFPRGQFSGGSFLRGNIPGAIFRIPFCRKYVINIYATHFNVIVLLMDKCFQPINYTNYIFEFISKKSNLE